jgi:hypothetical protein
VITTLQLVIICLTILVLAAVIAGARWKVRRLEIHERMRGRELDAQENARHALQAAAAANRPLPIVSAPQLGAKIAVHIDGRVVQGTLDAKDMGTYVVLKEASVVSGREMQPLGGRQYLTASLVTQMQEF